MIHLATKRNANTLFCTATRAGMAAGNKVEKANADKTYGWRFGYCKACARVHDAKSGAVVAAAPEAAQDLAVFARRVLETARTLTTGRFGEDRVFISHVFQALRSELGMSEAVFKARLLVANQKRLLSLSRADMVEWMDPTDVTASEIRNLGSTVHFIAL